MPHVSLSTSQWTRARALPVDQLGSGSGSHLNETVLLVAQISTLVATIVSSFGIYLQLKNYRKPRLQRMVVRIMIMVPIYAIASLISLFSLEAAFVIDAIRDIYEAFVIYCFFHLLLAYLGGERSLLILLYGRQPLPHVFPVNLFKREFDPSDPFTFLFLRRGILQYVQVKPVLAAVTLILKATGTFHEGDLSWTSGYLWVSIVYNCSICLALYCLANFWRCVSGDIKPFRPVPKFLCVKGILFFSFWQALGISILVAAGVIRSVGPYTDPESISLALTDTLICFEMPFFAFAHWFAFSHQDYIDPDVQYAARMPFYYAFRDAFGSVDVLQDSKATFKGGVSYRTFEPVEGGMHQGVGRARRIRAGLRYAKGGKQKYWLPAPPDDREPGSGPVHDIRQRAEEHYRAQHGYVPVLDNQPRGILLPDSGSDSDDEDGGDGRLSLEFDDPDEQEEVMYAESRKLVFGDYHYPAIDVSGEAARKLMWEEEERILKDQRAAAFSPVLGGQSKLLASAPVDYGATTTIGGVQVLITDVDEDNNDKKGKAPAARSGVYGAWAEREPDDVAAGRRDGPSVRSTPRNAAIDMTGDQPEPRSPVGGNVVRLGYTKGGKLGVLPSSSIPAGGYSNRSSRQASPTPSNRAPRPSPSPQFVPSRPSSPPGSVAGSFNSRSGSLPPRSRLQQYSRPDAVDLVVEDKRAFQQDMIRERRKGEPAVRQIAKRRVYRREYVPEEDETRSVLGDEMTDNGIDSDDEYRQRGRDTTVVRPTADMQDHRFNIEKAEDSSDEERPGRSEIVNRIGSAATPQRDFARSDLFFPQFEEPNPWA